MTKIAIIVGGVGILILGAFASPGIRLTPGISITRPEEGYQSSLGVVNGLRSCGGPGQVIQWRYESCHGSGICQVPADGQMRKSELEFIPSQDSSALGIRFLVITDGEVAKAYDRAISNSEVEEGQKYIVNATGGANEDLKGKRVTLQYILYRVEDGNVEVCSEADIEVV